MKIVYYIYINPEKDWKSIISGQIEDLKIVNLIPFAELYCVICTENKELFDWFSAQKENETLRMYLDEIKKLVTQNKYQMLGDQFTDKNIRNNPLFGDVRTNLESFYNQFNDLFKFDESGEINMKYDDEATPYSYVRQLGQVFNPGRVYTETLKKPAQTT